MRLLHEEELRTGVHNLDRVKMLGRTGPTVKGYMSVVLRMLQWCRARRRRVSAECLALRIEEFVLAHALPPPGTDTRPPWSATTAHDSRRKLFAGFGLLGFPQQCRDPEAAAIHAALEYADPSRVAQPRRAVSATKIFGRIGLEWRLGQFKVARLMLVEMLGMLRPAELRGLNWLAWVREPASASATSPRLLTMSITSKTHRLQNRRILWPEGPPGSVWELIWQSSWLAAGPPASGAPRTGRGRNAGPNGVLVASEAEMQGLRNSLKAVGMLVSGLRATGYTFWRDAGVPGDVAKSMGSWAQGSAIPAKHYLRLSLMGQTLAAATSSGGLE